MLHSLALSPSPDRLQQIWRGPTLDPLRSGPARPGLAIRRALASGAALKSALAPSGHGGASRHLASWPRRNGLTKGDARPGPIAELRRHEG